MTWQELETYIRGQAADIGTATRAKVAGVNFITPDVVTTRNVGGHLVELAYGQAFGGGWVVGVSVRPDGFDMSRSCTPEELPRVLADIVGTLTGAGVA